jgi:hypothetical protein
MAIWSCHFVGIKGANRGRPAGDDRQWCLLMFVLLFLELLFLDDVLVIERLGCPQPS